MLLALQTPLPPAPPFGPSQIEGVLVAMAIVAIATVGFFLLKPLIQALARRIENRGDHPALRSEMEMLHDRIGQVETLQRRVLELEERLEFTERLLAQQRDQAVIRPGGER